jgi:hypothetical protein
MKKIVKYFFGFLIVFSILHLYRDILQNFHIKNMTTNFLGMDRNWCNYYCNWITFPFEIFILIGSIIELKRNKLGLIGYLVFGIFAIWLVMFLYDYFIFN